MSTIHLIGVAPLETHVFPERGEIIHRVVQNEAWQGDNEEMAKRIIEYGDDYPNTLVLLPMEQCRQYWIQHPELFILEFEVKYTRFLPENWGEMSKDIHRGRKVIRWYLHVDGEQIYSER